MRPMQLAFLVCLAAVAVPAAHAAEALRVEIGKTTMLRLKDVPEIVILGDPAIADVIVERKGLLFLVGRIPGETDIKILDAEGRTVLSRPVVVTPIGERHVTVHRGVEEATLSCNPRCAGVPNQVAPGAVQPANQPAVVAAPGAPQTPLPLPQPGGLNPAGTAVPAQAPAQPAPAED